MRKTDLTALSICNIFKNTDETVLIKLLSGEYEILKFEKNEDIFTPSHFRKGLAVILKGKAEVWKHTENGALYMSCLSEGNVFGMSSIFYNGEDFPTTVTAKEKMRLLFITKEQLNELFMSRPEILENFLMILSNKIHFLNEKIESLSTPSASDALKTYLLDTAKHLGTSKFSLPVSYQKLASLLSIGRTSLYRAFDTLTEEGFLEKNGKVITINNFERNETL